MEGDKLSSAELIAMEEEFGAHNYHPLPVVIERAEGIYMYDVEGKQYFDFLSGYSALSQGNCHPRIVQAMKDQLEKCTLTSRAFHNSEFPKFAKFITEMFGYESVLPMNSGAEAVETALKLARRWGYDKKGIPINQAMVVSANGCFHGRTAGVISMSTDPSATNGFGPFIPGHLKVPYDDVESLQRTFEQYGDKICGFLIEPIQGEGGVIIPHDGYLKQCETLCKQYNILLVIDEIQTGLSRCGKLLCSQWDNVRGDILILGKALSGGMMPISCILADKEIMLCIHPGEHGSTFGGNPLASAVAIASLSVIRDENLADNSLRMGKIFRRKLRHIKCPYIKEIRGRGLFNAIEITKDSPVSAWDICLWLKEKGILTKPTHETSIRLAPPLTITKPEIRQVARIIREVFESI